MKCNEVFIKCSDVGMKKSFTVTWLLTQCTTLLLSHPGLGPALAELNLRKSCSTSVSSKTIGISAEAQLFVSGSFAWVINFLQNPIRGMIQSKFNPELLNLTYKFI